MTKSGSNAIHHSLQAWVRALEMIAPIARRPNLTLPILLENFAERYGSATALLSDHECLTYRELADRSNRYARWALAQGIAGGDVVCLLMPNRPEYLAIWLGITSIGGIVALLNTNLTGNTLTHAINIAAPKYVIVASDLLATVNAVLSRFAPRVQCWVHGESSNGFPRIDREIEHLSGGMLPINGRQLPSIIDPALYIYTSGTTGLPKAVIVNHFRLMQWTHWFAGMMDVSPDDRMYNCLPMYHSVGGVVATGAVLVGGGSVFIRPHFSASHFWDDVIKRDCTLFQYIGELCRYLVLSPPRPTESEHRIRLCCGNGLRADVWDAFQQRFRIPRILEFYAATEGNVSLYNCEGKPGSIGRIPPFLAHRFPIALIKYDSETGQPARDANGFCTACMVDEVGEACGKIDVLNPSRWFEGYTDKDASNHKVLRNVFENGDTWFRTGDLMRRDKSGFFYFVDRLGDTFRWKGENVSTTEVAESICAYPGVTEAVVYGVEIPGMDGRCGMAAVVFDQDIDLVDFRGHLTSTLPEYAIPSFLRICPQIEITPTFKPRTMKLAQEGFNPSIIANPLYFNDQASRAFVKLGTTLYAQIQTGCIRL
jgi:fatty-acyl-CoA synthase